MNSALPGQRQLYASPASRFCMLVLAVLLLAQMALGASAWSVSNRVMLPELERKAEAVAAALADEMKGALAQGGTADGIQRYFDATLRTNPDIAFLVLAGADGRVLYRSGQGGEIMAPERYLRRSSAIVHRYITYGRVEVGIDRNYLGSRSGALPWLLGAIAFASLLLALEVLRCSVTLNVIAPMRQALRLVAHMASGDFRYRAAGEAPQVLVAGLNQACASINRAFSDLARLAAKPQRRARAEPVVRRLRQTYRFAEHGIDRALPAERAVAVRLLAFIPVFAEMLARVVLPVHAGSMARSTAIVPYEFGAALPLACFLAAAAGSLTLAARWPRRAGRRTVYLAGALLAAAGVACSALADSYMGLCAARLAAGAGFGWMFASCHGYVVDNTPHGERIAGMMTFVGAMLLAELGAPLIGGVLAGHAGVAAVLVTASGILLAAVPACFILLDDSGAHPGLPALPAVRSPSTNAHSRALDILAIAPSAFVFAAFPMLLAPLALSALGFSPSDAARVLLAYGAPAIVLAPAFGSMAQRFNIHAPLTCLGALVGGLAMLPLATRLDAGSVATALAALGLGHAMSIPAQLALAGRFNTRDTASPSATAAFIGAACGALAAGYLAGAFGVANAANAIGIAAITTSFLFALAFLKLGTGGASGPQA